MASTSASAQHQWTYDVFVSFRGEDIRKGFMDHLFKDFRQKGIHAFRDDNQLPRGEEISSQLYKAIEESRFLIVIFSKNYASSSWCLKELVKIIECKEIGEHTHEVQIIFYDVKPNVVRKQTESYAEAFLKHEISNRTEVAKWKEALTMASNLSGWDLQDHANGYESKLIDSISKEILLKLCNGPLYVGENLVAVDARIEKIDLLRFVRSNKVHMIGICGIGGIGKTTFAKAIYNLMYIHFEECSFLDDVQGTTKRHELIHVVMQLINNIMKTTDMTISNIGQAIMVLKHRMAARQILLVLDDVDHHDQLEALAGSPDWFFPGSLIIFTSKDKQLLRSHKVEEIYDMEFLNDVESLKLFSLYAFHAEHPTKDFREVARQVVQYVKGHPLALKVLGCFLHGKNVREWKSELESLQVSPNGDIQRVLRLSYVGLSTEQKNIFLDIACLFVSEYIDFVARVLDSCDYFADTNIRVLVDKSLLYIYPNGLIEMHDLIQRMAIEIIREESNISGKRSRLWISEEVYEVLNEHKGTEAVEVLELWQKEHCQKVYIDGKAFVQMKNLRILKICDEELRCDWLHTFDWKLWKESKVNYHGNLKFLSNKLRLFYWHRFPFKCFPSDFYPESIVAIDLSYGLLKNLWTSPKCFTRLKVMKLRHCRYLKSTPDFTLITNLEELILEGCVKLVTVHPSVGMLKKLVVLNMRDCKCFRKFPCKVEMDSLKVLHLSGCSKLDKLPEFFSTIQTLREFSVDGTAITELPSFVFSQCNLQVLEFGRRKEKRSRWWSSIFQRSWLPSKMKDPQMLVMPSLASLCFLEYLNLSDCNMLEVSDSIGGLSCLISLKLDRNNFTSLPDRLSQLSDLLELRLSGCNKLELLPQLPPNLCVLDAEDCTSLYQFPPKKSYIICTSICVLLSGCTRLLRDVSIGSQVCMSQPRLDLNSSITSHSCRNQISSFLQIMEFPSNTHGIFGGQEMQSPLRSLDITYHGNIIPQWFTNTSTGNHIQVELPPNYCYNKVRGHALCVVLTPKNSYGHKKYYCDLRYSMNNFDGTCLLSTKQLSTGSVRIRKQDIISLHFMNTKSRQWVEAKNFVSFSFEDHDDVEVKECGVRLVFCEDIQEEETGLSIIKDLPTPTQDGGCIVAVHNDNISCCWQW